MNIILGHEAHDPTHLNVKLNYVAVSTIAAACQPKAGKIYTKDVVCLMPTKKVNSIPIPRGKNRACLADMGLIGKVYINSAWRAEEVAKEITSVFASAFNLQPG